MSLYTESKVTPIFCLELLHGSLQYLLQPSSDCKNTLLTEIGQFKILRVCSATIHTSSLTINPPLFFGKWCKILTPMLNATLQADTIVLPHAFVFGIKRALFGCVWEGKANIMTDLPYGDIMKISV